MSRLLVAGIGNIFLGDDGFGPAVIQRLVAAAGGPALPAGVSFVDYGIRGMHLAYDLLDGYDGLILIDTVAGQEPAGSVTVMEISEQPDGQHSLGPAGVDAHGMDPATVLASLRALGGELPRTLLVGCIPADLEDGIGLSPPVSAAIEPAALTVLELLAAEFRTGTYRHADATTAAGD